MWVLPREWWTRTADADDQLSVASSTYVVSAFPGAPKLGTSEGGRRTVIRTMSGSISGSRSGVLRRSAPLRHGRDARELREDPISRHHGILPAPLVDSA